MTENRTVESSRTHFLLVEDDSDHAEIITRTIKRHCPHNTIQHAKDGLEALAYLRREGPYDASPAPDIILLDLKLPKMSGLELLAEIRQDPNLADRLVIVLSTSSAELDLSNAYKNHVNSYLVKPLDANCFRKMVEDMQSYWGQWNQIPPKKMQ